MKNFKQKIQNRFLRKILSCVLMFFVAASAVQNAYALNLNPQNREEALEVISELNDGGLEKLSAQDAQTLSASLQQLERTTRYQRISRVSAGNIKLENDILAEEKKFRDAQGTIETTFQNDVVNIARGSIGKQSADLGLNNQQVEDIQKLASVKEIEDFISGSNISREQEIKINSILVESDNQARALKETAEAAAEQARDRAVLLLGSQSSNLGNIENIEDLEFAKTLNAAQDAIQSENFSALDNLNTKIEKNNNAIKNLNSLDQLSESQEKEKFLLQKQNGLFEIQRNEIIQENELRATQAAIESTTLRNVELQKIQQDAKVAVNTITNRVNIATEKKENLSVEDAKTFVNKTALQLFQDAELTEEFRKFLDGSKNSDEVFQRAINFLSENAKDADGKSIGITAFLDEANKNNQKKLQDLKKDQFDQEVNLGRIRSQGGQLTTAQQLSRVTFNLDKIGQNVNSDFRETGVGGFAASMVRLMISLAAILSVLGICIGGVLMLISAGNEDTLSKGKDTVYYSVIGLCLVLLSYLIVATLQTVIFAIGG